MPPLCCLRNVVICYLISSLDGFYILRFQRSGRLLHKDFKDVNRHKITTLFQATIIQSYTENIIRPNQQNTNLALPNDSEYSHTGYVLII